MNSSEPSREANQPAPAPAGWASLPRLAPLVLAVAAFALYLRGVDGPFVYDDTFYVVDNPTVRSLKLALTTFGRPEAVSVGIFAREVYRPLIPVVYAAAYALGGMNPAVFHLLVAGLHALNAALLFWLLYVIVGRWGPALAGAAWWAVHPVHVEAVQWISGLDDVMSPTLLLLALLLLWRRRPWAALGAYAVALLTKEIAVIGPAAVLIVVWLRESRPWRERWRAAVLAALPFVAAAAAYVALRGSLIGVAQKTDYWGGSFAAAMAISARALLLYVRLIALPVVLRANYLFEPAAGLAGAAVGGAVAGLAALAALANAGRRPALAAGIAWFFVCLAPVSNILPIQAFANERFLYMPLMGLALVVADLAARLTRHRRACAILWTVTAAALAALTLARIDVWRDEERFLLDTIAKEPRIIGYQRALAQRYAAQNRWTDAERLYRQMQRRWPDSIEVAIGLAGTLESDGRADEAEAAWRDAVVAHPHSVDAAQGAARFLCRQGEFARAALMYDALVAAAPDNERLREERRRCLEPAGGS